ncbi:hypothetical protein ScPMuIL_011304 [Solemya velum]
MDSLKLYVLVAVVVSLFLHSTTAEIHDCSEVFSGCLHLLRRHAPGRENKKCLRVFKRCIARVANAIRENKETVWQRVVQLF